VDDLLGKEKAILGLKKSIENATEKEKEKTPGRIEKLQDILLKKEDIEKGIDYIKSSAPYQTLEAAKEEVKKFRAEIGLDGAETDLADYLWTMQNRVDPNSGINFEKTCEYFVDEIADALRAKLNHDGAPSVSSSAPASTYPQILVVHGLQFQGVSVPEAYTGEFDFLILEVREEITEISLNRLGGDENLSKRQKEKERRRSAEPSAGSAQVVQAQDAAGSDSLKPPTLAGIKSPIVTSQTVLKAKVLKLVECKNNPQNVRTDCKKKYDAMMFFNGRIKG